MPNEPQDNQPVTPQPSAIEQQVTAMLGPPPREANKPEEPIPTPAPTPQPEPTPASLIGSVISPSLPPAADVPLADQSQNTPTEPTDDNHDLSDNSQSASDDIDQRSAQINSDFHGTASAKPPGGKLKRFLHAWWGNKKRRRLSIIGLVAVIMILLVTPASRYFLLNNVGVRSSASVTVLDDSTQLPLRNVQVKLANGSALTDENGQVKLEHLKLGRSNLVIEKRAFAQLSQPVTVGWGSNPLGNFPIKAVGAQYAFLLKDWLTGKPVTKAEATSGDASAFSDTSGKILLTIDPAEVKDNMIVTIVADGYRSEPVALDTASKTDQMVSMVLARKEVFISNRSGKYDLYSVDIDGKNERLVLPGTGLERDDMVLVPHPTAEVAALVSTRVNVRNADDYLLSTLTLVNLTDNSTYEVSQSERIQLVGWIGDRLIFVQIAAGASAADSNRFRLMSYDYKTADKTQLASANSFNDVITVGSSIYYSPSAISQHDPTVGLIVSNADGSVRKTLLDKEVWNIFRVSYDTLDLATQQSWYEYKIDNSNPVKLNESPANPKSRIYTNNPANTHSLWVDQRDGKGVLLDYDLRAQTDKILQTQGGLSYPLRWLDSQDFIYRVHTESETADYVMSLDGGQPHKIRDVYNAAGIDKWYYY